MASLSESNAVDCGSPRVQAHYARKQPLSPCDRWVTPRGDVMHVPICSSGETRRDHDPRAYRKKQQVYARKNAVLKAQGKVGRWIPYGECAVISRYTPEGGWPEGLGVTPCEEGTYGEKGACPHVEYAISLFRGIHTDEMRALEEAERRKRNSAADAQREQNELLREAVTTMADSMRAKGNRGRRRDNDAE